MLLTTNNQNFQFEKENMSVFSEVLGFTVTEWALSKAVLHVEMNKTHLNRNGFVHGGVFMSLLASAAGLCGTYCSVPGNVRRCITVPMNTHFISPVREEHLRVEASLVSRGRKMFFVEARISSDEGLVATGQGALGYVLGGEKEEGMPAQ